MLSRYHIEITKRSLGAFFTFSSLRDITHANVAQDSIASLFGVEARRHVCDCTVGESLAYIAEEHALIVELSQQPGTESKQRAALGRLLHTAQDFYAHTNYVAIWAATQGQDVLQKGLDALGVDGLGTNAIDPTLFSHPALQIAEWVSWREPLYYIPGLGALLRRFWLPTSSHEAINLDSPKQGVYFYLAMAIARQRTLKEYSFAVAKIREVAGMEAVARFHGFVSYESSAALVEI